MFGELRLAAVVLLLVVSVMTRHGLLFTVSLALLLAAAVSSLWDRYALERIEYRRYLSHRRAFLGEEIELTLEIVNRKALPLAWLETEDAMPCGLVPLKGKLVVSHEPCRVFLANLLSMRWYERVRRHYRVRCDARGDHILGPVKLRSGDLFGFSNKEIDLPGEDHLIVYPKVMPISQLGLPSKDPFGDQRTRHWLFEDPLRTVGVREYVFGDNPRRIHWKATARTQELQVKLYEPTTTLHLLVFLNLNTSGPFWWWHGYRPEVLELAISTAASVATWAVEQGYQVGLAANSRLVRTDQSAKVAPSRDPEQLTHVLEALARVLPFATMPFESLLREESRTLPYGATLVFVAALLSDEILAELLALQARGHRLALLLIGDGAPRFAPNGIRTCHVDGEVVWREGAEMACGKG